MKVVWGLEPKSQNTKTIKAMHSLLKNLVSKANDLSVGYVVTENESYLYTAFDVPVAERLTAYPRELINKDLKSAGVRIKQDAVHIINYRTLSKTAAVDRFLKFANFEKAKLIALFTHNKKGLERLIMGSFAETAVHRSRIDLLLAGPKTKYPQRIKNIFYASDFSPRSKRDLHRVLELCKQVSARLTVFHAAEITYHWPPDEASSEILAYRRKIKKMQNWIESECKKAKVSFFVKIKTELESTADLAIKGARSAKADLIIVGAKAGPLAALMGGSVTRKIVRNGSYPVLILKS